jgi:D-alanyl-D-alanine carboxypeptidase
MSSEAVLSIPSGTSHIALTTDEEVTMEQLVYAATLQSANDACNGIAEHVGGSIAGFVDMMNSKAKQLGAVNTHFANAHGLSDDNHYTTAYDMALITQYALRVEGFIKFFSNTTFEMPPNNKQKEIRSFAQQHEMLKPGKFQYEGAICGKVGWTTKSGHTLVTVAERNGRRLICVVMKSETRDQRYNDTKLLFDYGFNEFVDAVLPKDKIEQCSLPVSKDNKDLGVVSYTIENDAHYLIRRDLIDTDLIFEKNLPDKCEDLKVLPTASFNILIDNVTGYLPCKILTLNYLAKFIPSGATDLEKPEAVTTPVNSIPTTVARTFWTFVKIIGIIAAVLIILFILMFIILLIRKKIVLATRRRQKREKLLNKKP